MGWFAHILGVCVLISTGVEGVFNVTLRIRI